MAVAGFKRGAVLTAAIEARDNLQHQLDDWKSRAEREQAKHRARWLDEDKPRLREVRDKLTAALKTNEPVTSAQLGDINRLLFTPLSDWQLSNRIGYMDRQAKRDVQNKIVAYNGVIKLLLAQEGGPDEVLSIAALKNLGINKLGELFRAAADKGGSVDKSPI